MAFNKNKYTKTQQSGKPFTKKKEEFLDYFKGRDIEVRYDDVNGALRRLKKVLEKMDFQKELSKREHYEKPSVKRKRMKDQAVKRTRKEVDTMISNGEYMPTPISGQSYLKGKREKRKSWVAKERIRRLRDRGRT